ncbi:transposase [Sorangium sp. So ce1014]|uniref:transposase n=1 Tax=Sorangium sp. So ce1014 TaxID=3133326 RepID=UPI003F611FF8
MRVLAALLDGNSERAVERMTEVNRETVGRLSLAFGRGAERLHDRLVRDLRTQLIQVDEVFGYVGKKPARVTKDDPESIGEAYTFVAMDTLSRLVIAWRVGRRDQETTDAFMADVRARLLVMPQITSDGFAPYISAVGAQFGPSVDFMQTVKNYRTGSYRGPDHRYEPPRDPFITKTTIYGAPDAARASTAYVERQNGTHRHQNGRMRRLCYAFSKKFENHRAAAALHYVAYNLCWVVKTLRVTPAMQAGITDHVWTVDELADALLTEPASEAPKAQPLSHREPSAPARKLPSGRGWLRLVTEPTPALKRPQRAPEPTPPASPVQAAPPPAPVAPAGPVQLDLFSWKPDPSDTPGG